jgi:DNA polymerase III gamma/tau subunit
MENKIWIGLLFLLVAGIFLSSAVHADCDEERIRLSISDLITSKVAEIGVNTDNSFKAYEQFNTKQLGDTISGINKIMQQGAYTALIALFGMVFLSLSIWSLIKLKKEKNILMTILNEMRDERKSHALVMDRLTEFMAQKVQPQPVHQQAQVQAQQQAWQDIPVPIPPKKEKRGFLGLFKGKKKQEQAPVQSPLQQQPFQQQPVQMRAQVYESQVQQEQAFQDLQQQLLKKYELDQQQKSYLEYQAQQAQLKQQAQKQVYEEMQRREFERMQAESDVKRITDELEEKKKLLLDMYQKKPRSTKHGASDGTAQAPVGLAQDAGIRGSGTGH